MDPRGIIALGFILVLLGFLVPFLMVLHVIQTSFFLGFISYGASVTGLFLGLLGSVLYARMKRR
jgi:hypothetical protein